MKTGTTKIAIVCIGLLGLAPVFAGVPSRYASQNAQWFQSQDGRRIADNVLSWQSPHGDWPKNRDTASQPCRADKDNLEGTFDNGATTGELRFLALAFRATNESRYREAVLKGFHHILEAQYPNGGWPQFFPLSPGYHRHITFNDGAMVGVMTLLRAIAEGEPPLDFVDQERRAKAEAAVSRGLDCLLKTQVKQNGKLTVWCAQYDEKTLAPAWARAYEPPSLSGAESVGIVRFLMYVNKPTPEMIAAVEAAVEWFKSVAIYGMRCEQFTDVQGRKDRRIIADPEAGPLWARFYELGSNRPIFLDRDSVVRYSLAEIGQERRGGYAWYGEWADKLVAEDYPKWRVKHNLPNR